MRLPPFTPPTVPDKPDPDYLKYYDAAFASWHADVETELASMIDEKHAPVMIPRVTTIDTAHNPVAANGTAWTALSWGTSGSTGSAALVTILSYTGRGVLRTLAVAEITSGGAAANNVNVRLTVDGRIIYPNVNILTTQSTLSVVVGQLHRTSSSDIEIYDDPIGIPFNKTILIEGATQAGTGSFAWRISKKA